MRPRFLQSIEAAAVSPRMLEEVSISLADAVREAEGKPIDDPVFVVFRTFIGRELDHFTLTAILFRMQALSDLIAGGKIKEWQLPGIDADGAVSISTNVFHAAANARLILSNRRGASPKFRLAEFKELALAAAETEGRG